jgi:hypothetical protein
MRSSLIQIWSEDIKARQASLVADKALGAALRDCVGARKRHDAARSKLTDAAKASVAAEDAANAAAAAFAPVVDLLPLPLAAE